MLVFKHIDSMVTVQHLSYHLLSFLKRDTRWKIFGFSRLSWTHIVP